MARERLKHGLIQVYTGNGKGKTTAAFGLALRAAGRGLRVFILQFMKGGNYGEVKAVKLLKPYITIKQTGLCTFVDKNNPSQEDIRIAKEGLKIASKAILCAEKSFEGFLLHPKNERLFKLRLSSRSGASFF